MEIALFPVANAPTLIATDDTVFDAAPAPIETPPLPLLARKPMATPPSVALDLSPTAVLHDAGTRSPPDGAGFPGLPRSTNRILQLELACALLEFEPVPDRAVWACALINGISAACRTERVMKRTFTFKGMFDVRCA